MKYELHDLAAVNPVTIEVGETWAMTADGERARRRALEGETDHAENLSDHRSPRIRWPAAVVSGALVLLLALPALFFLGDEAPQSTTTTLPATTSSVTEDTIPLVEDAFYTAVLGCVADQTGNDFGAVTVDEDGSLTARGRQALGGAASGYPGPYQACFESATGLTGSLRNQTFVLSDGEASILLPDGWISTTDDLTPNVGDPWDRISIGTYSMLPTIGDSDSCALQALVDLSPDDVFIQILERSGPASATPRPPTYAGSLSGIDEGDFWECMSPQDRADLGVLRFLDFEHEGHQFYVLLALGAETGEDELHTAELILDRIVIRPEIAAGWTFTEIPFTIREGSAYTVGGGWMFAWGGASDGQAEMPRNGIMVNIDTGEGRLIPAAPIDGRYLPSAVWTGTEFIVFGGHSAIESLVDGAAYNPETRNWRLIDPVPLRPAANPAAVWTGAEMMVWLAGEDSMPTDLPQPTKGQLASYNPTTNSWTILNHPDLEIVDATLLLYGGNLMLIGGPNMRDVGVFGPSPSLSATVLDFSSQIWSQPVTDAGGESARVFMLGDSVAVLRDDGEILVLDETGWEPFAEFGDSCSHDLGAASGDGSSYLKFCGSNYLLDGNDIVLILAAKDYGATSNTYGSAFLATDDGRLVVVGDANSFYPASGFVVFGVYEPRE
jgi:hypothetical protein